MVQYFSLILLVSVITTTSSPVFAKTYSCIPPIKIIIDLGYCFGFTTSYFEAVNDTKTLTAIKDGHVRDNIKTAHEQCYPTRFDDQFILGELAFSSYIGLNDDSLLKDAASNCQLLMNHYAKQNQTAE